MTLHAFTLPKAGHAAGENEDAFAVPEMSEESSVEAPAWPLRVAVADGATEAAFARDWARRLADGFVSSEVSGAESFGVRLALWRAEWYDALQARGQLLPWYAQEKAKEGAHAAFLGLLVFAEGTWRALAVGDCCLFHLRRAETLTRWPIGDPAGFSHTPPLLSSLPDDAVPTLEVQAGDWRPGDAFILATDAAAAWLMQTDAAAVLDWDEAAFQSAAAEARAAGTLRNDDTTVMVVQP